MNISHIREQQKKALIDSYKKQISKLTKPALNTEWDKVRQELNPNCKVAANTSA